MTKPLDHVREPQQSDRKLSVADWREIFRTVKELVNISVAAPLTKTVSAGEILLALAGTLLPPGKKGEILYYDGEHWVTLPVPAWNERAKTSSFGLMNGRPKYQRSVVVPFRVVGLRR